MCPARTRPHLPRGGEGSPLHVRTHGAPCAHSHAPDPRSLPPPPRSYILNVKCADYSPEHLWQMRIVTPPAQWRTIALPFSEMMLTRRGRVELEQREINRDCINGVRDVAWRRAPTTGGVASDPAHE